MIVIGVMVLAALCVGLIGYALMYNSIADDKKSNARIKSMHVDQKSRKKAQSKRVDEKTRRKNREATLKNVENQRAAGKKAAKPSLSMKITQAGLTWSMTKFYVICFISGIFVFFAALIFLRTPLLISLGLSLVGGVGLPLWIVGMKRKKRFKRFTSNFPGAIDIIVRGIKSGLPLNDCLRIIAIDAEEPVRSEFRKVVESNQMGLSVSESCERLYDAIPTPETNFFAIVIAIQSSAGGNLSEALGNLSGVLRERRKLADKVAAFSTEAKTSATIIGALPFVVAGMVHITTPSYMVPLFTEPGGKKVLLFCALSMGAGIFIMRKMINFKF